VAGAEAGGGGDHEAAPSLVGPRIIAGLLIAGGAFLIYHSFQIGATHGYSVVGPSIAPIAVSVCLLALGVIFALRTTVLLDEDLASSAGAEEAITHWPTVLLLAVLLVGYAVALAPLGYIVATALLLPISSRILGSTHPLRDAVIAVGLALVIYFGFTAFLGIRLPQGILAPVL
jgi:putative tricarboxylic transport membrane protein